ncbi:ATP-dependent helicase HrpB [Thalassotalea insulae]|uniref:ATP-dependent helicase HrpB n=1 Tax=Thalassotalea insulae TaxID=2056778 RepID=A0ABQ6GSW7_9GAMM|nr:ATP-dependent helicase HrpB [Thalassotalea insulae]GLX79018.1 ATP-dependent helicase HrpB [Thalassotalea insulae]
MPLSLPIEEIKTEFIHALEHHQTVILSAEPGAGKSTRLPLWLLEDSANISGKIYLLQPRRVAVKNIAYYLAEQLGEPVGQSVGYRLRNEAKTSSQTRLEVVTEGILVQIMQNDPELAETSIVILDEFHERSLQADLAFALARDIQQGLHEELTLILMSATLASKELQQTLPDAVVLSSQGRSFPVDVIYRPPANMRLWREHLLKVLKQSLSEYAGSILVFLPGSGDIRYLVEQLVELASDKLLICPLYGDLTLNEQQQAIAPCNHGCRKIVLATNIAETSLTIEGINLVIDSGLEKVAIYDDSTLTNRLVQRNIAKSSAIQRAGRAGRVAEGTCIRLFAEEEFHRRNSQSELPIIQADILPLVIEAARWGVSRLSDLPLLDLPIPLSETIAWQALFDIDAVDSKHKLTEHGTQLAKLPCHPRFAHMIIRARELEQDHQCLGLAYLACLLAALLEERDIFTATQAEGCCDINQRIQLLVASKNYRHRQIIQQAKRLAKMINSKMAEQLPLDKIGILLFLAYPERFAKRRQHGGEYLASYGKGLQLTLQDALINEEYLVAAVVSGYRGTLQIRLAAPVDVNLLQHWQLVTETEQQVCAYQADRQRIIAVHQKKLGGIVIEQSNIKSSISEQQAAAVWLEQIAKQGLSFLNWQTQDQELVLRWRWLNQTQQQSQLPDISEATLLNSLALWLQPFLTGIFTKAELNKLNVSTMLLSMLDYSQQQLLDNLAPSYFIGPTGRKCPIRYSLEQTPIVSLPMQEVYGMNASPVVGQGQQQVNLTLELLSPAQRPIQVTSDLAGFWQGSYRAVQKEMKAKYPKHYWPDDPANATPTNKTKRHLSL